MTVDRTKLAFSSSNDIDNLIATGTVAVGAGVSAVTNYASVSLPPVFVLQFQPNSTTLWYQMGGNDHGGAIALHGYADVGTIYINASIAGTVRYFVWSDKINY